MSSVEEEEDTRSKYWREVAIKLRYFLITIVVVNISTIVLNVSITYFNTSTLRQEAKEGALCAPTQLDWRLTTRILQLAAEF